MLSSLRSLLFTLVALVPGLVIGGCASVPPSPDYPELTFAHLGRISLDVARIQVKSTYVPPLKAPHVEHRAPLPPYAAIQRWAEQRLVPAGRRNAAHLVIVDASIKRVPLKPRGGLHNMFTREQSARFDGSVAVRLEILDPGGRQLAFVSGRATRSTTVGEGASIAEREKVWFAITEEMLSELDRQLDREIKKHFRKFVIGR